MIRRERLVELLRAFPARRIGLVGDLFLDRYLDIDPEMGELSIETGLEAYQITRVRNSPGALGTVINNLAALGVGRMVPVTVLGDDGQAYDLLQALAPLPVDTQHVVRDRDRLTPTYTKPLRRDPSGAWRELNRLDLRNRRPLSTSIEDDLLARIEAVWQATDGMIVVDQVNEENWGVVNERVRTRLHELAAAEPARLLFVDSRAHLARFACGTLKPNAAECLRATGRPIDSTDEATIAAAAQQLSNDTGCPLFCTRGERGMLVVEPGGKPTAVPTPRVAGPIDIVGAGDSATAGVVASLLSGATRIEAAHVGCLVASITIEQLGTTGTATPQQVLDRWGEASPDC